MGVAVFDLDKVLLAGDASTLFLRGLLARTPARTLPLLAAAPLLVPGSAVPGTRPLAARAMTRLAVGGRDGSDVEEVAAAYGRALAVRPEAAVAEGLACLRAHRAAGDRVVVATGCEEVLARGFLTAVGFGDVDVVGSTGSFLPPRVRRAMGEGKVAMLTDRGYPPRYAVAYSDSTDDVPLFAAADRPVLVNASEEDADRVARELGRRPETVTWR